MVLGLDDTGRQAASQIAQQPTGSTETPEQNETGERSPSAGRTVGEAVASILGVAGYQPGSSRERAGQALLAATSGVALHELGAAHVERARASYAHLAEWTRCNRDRAMKWLLDCIAMQGGPELRECFRGTRTPAARREVPTMAELRVLRSCPNPALRWMILCGSEAGLRSGAAYGCTLRNCLDGRITAITKNGVITNTPTSPRLQALLAIVPAETPLDTQVVHALEGAPVAQKTLRRRWWEWKKRCNVRTTVRMHDLRRSLARRVYDTSHDLRQVQALLSHANLTSTLWYLDAGQPELEDTNLTQAIAAQENPE